MFKRLAHVLFIITFAFNNLFSSISRSVNTVQYNLSIFETANMVALASINPGGGVYSLARIGKTFNDETEKYSLELAPYTNATVVFNQFDKKQINFEKDAVNPNPLFNKGFSSLASHNGIILAVPTEDTADPIIGPNQKIFAVSGDKGQLVYSTTTQINDCQGLPTNGIFKMSSNGSQIFLALSPNDGSFGDTNSSIGLASYSSSTGKFSFMDATTGEFNGNIAYKLDTTAGELMAITSDAQMGPIIDMHWDSKINRLFIALQVTRANSAVNGGGIALLIGRVITTQLGQEPENSKNSENKNNPIFEYQLILEPALALNPSLFTTDATNAIIGFFASGGSPDIKASLYKVKTLHTSTNYSYVIVNGGVSTTDTKNNIYALPIVRPIRAYDSQLGMTVEQNPSDIGKIANKYSSMQQVATSQSMTLASDSSSIVGGGPLPIDPSNDVQNIFTIGDAVFVALAGNSEGIRNSSNETGIFQSSAILDSNGQIKNWTPWQRVMGSTDRVLNFSIDSTIGTFMYVTGDPNSLNANIIKSTLWSEGSQDGLLGGTEDNSEVGLTEILYEAMPKDNEGIHQIFNFDEYTFTFKAVGTDGNLSLMIACGFEKIAIIETGAQVGSSTSFGPNSGDFAQGLVSSENGFAATPNPSTKVMIISGGALNQLGPISCCEISRANLQNGTAKGWIFLGGPNGLSVLSDYNGNGWDTSIGGGLSSGLNGINSSMKFKILGNFTNIRALQSDSQYLYVLTIDTLYKIELNSNYFSDIGAPNVPATIIATSKNIIGNNYGFMDFIISSKLGLIATTKGLFRVGDSKDISSITSESNALWTEVLFKAPNGSSISLGPTIGLNPLSQTKGNFSKGGNLFALIGNFNTNNTSAIRFFVNDTSSTSQVDPYTVTQVLESSSSQIFFDAGEFRNAFICDGAFAFNSLPKNYNNTNFLKMFSLIPSGVDLAQRGVNVPLDIDPSLFNNIGVIRRNTASGAYMVPGDFGIQVNE